MTNYEELEKRSIQLEKFINHLDYFARCDRTYKNLQDICKNILREIKTPYSSIKMLELEPYEINLFKKLVPVMWLDEENKKTVNNYLDKLLNLVEFTINCVNKNTL